MDREHKKEQRKSPFEYYVDEGWEIILQSPNTSFNQYFFERRYRNIRKNPKYDKVSLIYTNEEIGVIGLMGCPIDDLI